MDLSNAEVKIIAELLKMASNEFCNHGCNDFVLEATEENKNLICQVIEDNGDSEWEEEAEHVRAQTKRICFHDSWLMSYFARKFEKHIKEDER